MQILENWDPLNLPRGSVRALVVLALLGVLWGLMVAGRDVSPLYASVVFIALGHYFAARTRRRGEEKERPPLGLPRGTIRFLITIGFGIVAWLLWSDGRLVFSGENRYAAIIVLAFALILGQVLGGLLRIVTRGRATRPIAGSRTSRRSSSSSRSVSSASPRCSGTSTRPTTTSRSSPHRS